MIFNATHTGDNEFELDGVPLGQVGKVWGKGGGDSGTATVGSSQ